MDLKLSLIFRIVSAGGLCLLFSTAYVLYQADREWRAGMSDTAQSAIRQLDKQLMFVSAGFTPAESFPDLQTVRGLDAIPALCVTFSDPEGTTVKIQCGGWNERYAYAPAWFARLYRGTFGGGRKISLPVVFENTKKGSVTFSDNPDAAASQAWHDVRGLIELQSISLLAVCLIIFASVRHALQPAIVIMGGLGRLGEGDLTVRLPPFRLAEFHSIGEGFNRLAGHLQQSILERTELTRRLFQVQEEERRALAQDLHDEFGQCLAAIRALAASINETAKLDHPDLLREGQSIAKTCEHMMQILRGTLAQLRPPVTEYGLVPSLNSLVNDWNVRLKGKTVFSLEIKGDAGSLPGFVGVNVYRIVQECLTNASKHADASSVRVKLECCTASPGMESVELSIEDDGKASENFLPARPGPGMGLLGIRERITALGGKLSIEAVKPSGLAVRASIPVRITLSGTSL
jgi:two-component system, NarL family, sensor histidine kinase UhpB